MNRPLSTMQSPDLLLAGPDHASRSSRVWMRPVWLVMTLWLGMCTAAAILQMLAFTAVAALAGAALWVGIAAYGWRPPRSG